MHYSESLKNNLYLVKFIAGGTNTKYALFLFCVFTVSTYSVDLLKHTIEYDKNTMYALGNKLCSSPSDMKKCQMGMVYLWSAHLKKHPNAFDQFIHYKIEYFEELSSEEKNKLYNLTSIMSLNQKTKLANRTAFLRPKKAQAVILEAALQNYTAAQWSYVQFALTHPNWEFNTTLIIRFLNNLKNQDNLPRLILAKFYAKGFLVAKNPMMFRNLASTVWRKFLNQPETLRKLVEKAQFMVENGRQKYDSIRKVNGSK